MRKLLLQACRIGQTDRVPILREINLHIYAGDFIAVLGAPRAGKSTLLRVLQGTDPATTGDLFYEGRLAAPGDPYPPTIRFIDDPPAVVLAQLRADHAGGQTTVIATADPEVAAYATTLYRLTDGTLYLIGG